MFSIYSKIETMFVSMVCHLITFKSEVIVESVRLLHPIMPQMHRLVGLSGTAFHSSLNSSSFDDKLKSDSKSTVNALIISSSLVASHCSPSGVGCGAGALRYRTHLTALLLHSCLSSAPPHPTLNTRMFAFDEIESIKGMAVSHH